MAVVALAPTIPTTAASAAPGKRDTVAAQARANVTHNAGVFGFGADQALVVKDVVLDTTGASHVRFDRTCQGLPVVGGDLAVHQDAKGRLKDSTRAAARDPAPTPTAPLPPARTNAANALSAPRNRGQRHEALSASTGAASDCVGPVVTCVRLPPGGNRTDRHQEDSGGLRLRASGLAVRRQARVASWAAAYQEAWSSGFVVALTALKYSQPATPANAGYLPTSLPSVACKVSGWT
ncbi:hypothetical protein BU198_18830 [Streptomyces sp. CBMA156]|nr:hypothetical protein [Streptomyces sp. CBMA156]